MATRPSHPVQIPTGNSGQLGGEELRRTSRIRLGVLLVLALVALAVFLVHRPVLEARALCIDDEQFLVRNELVLNPSWASAGRFLSEVRNPSTVTGYYLPLTMISLMLDTAQGGNPEHLRPYHRTSLLLHIASTLLLIVLLSELCRCFWSAILVGLLFGIHPLSVEPIAWVGERKTVLSAFFAFLSLWAYVRYAHASRHRWWPYVASWLAYVLALLSKPISTPLVLVMLLLDYWPLGRLSRRSVIEKIPFFLAASASAAITLISHAHSAGFQPTAEPFLVRAPLTMAYLTLFYLKKIVWPVALSPIYVLPTPISLTTPAFLLSVCATVLFLGMIAASWRWTRVAVVGAAIFFVLLLPTVGLVRYSWIIASDKYLYLPSVGFLLTLSYGLARSRMKLPQGGQVAVLAGVLLIAGFWMRTTRRQLTHWRNTTSLYEHMLAISPGSSVVHKGLGDVDATAGRFGAALPYYRRSLELDPDDPETLNNAGVAFYNLGRIKEAAGFYRRAIQINPSYANAHNNLGNVLSSLGDASGAMAAYQESLRLNPRNAEAHNNLAVAFAERGQLDQAVLHFMQALALNADSADTRRNLTIALVSQGDALRAAGKFDEAATAYRRALKLDPGREDARRSLERLGR